jgi:hypothetical protein
MAIEVLECPNDDGYVRCVMTCTTTGFAFGPVLLMSAEAADCFLAWLGQDPRSMRDAELERKYGEFRELAHATAFVVKDRQVYRVRDGLLGLEAEWLPGWCVKHLKDECEECG